MAARYTRTGDDGSYGSRDSRDHRSSRAGRSGERSRGAGSDRYASDASAYSRDRYGSGSRGSQRHAADGSRSSSRSGRASTGSRGSRGAATPHDRYRSSNYAHASGSSQYARTDAHYSSKAHRKMSRGRKVLIGVMCTLLVAVIGAGAAFAIYVNNVNATLRGGLTDDQFADVIDVLNPSTFDEPFYMLLIGSDERLEDATMGARTDTNIVARIDAPNNTVTLISIPRDTEINLDGYGQVKFNAAYTYGGLEGVITEANQLLGIEISHFAMVNFEELIQLVDVVGGVDVEVRERIDDPDAGDIVIEAGMQHLDGEAALVFARCRSYVDGDFTRTSNQRLLIEAIVNKVLSMPVTDLPSVVAAGAQCVTTDFTVNDLFGLVTQFQSVGDITMYSCMVPSTIDETRDANGNLIASYVVCDEAGLAKIMKVVEEGGDPSTVQTVGVTGSVLDDDGEDDASDGSGSTDAYNPANERGTTG